MTKFRLCLSPAQRDCKRFVSRLKGIESVQLRTSNGSLPIIVSQLMNASLLYICIRMGLQIIRRPYTPISLTDRHGIAPPSQLNGRFYAPRTIAAARYSVSSVHYLGKRVQQLVCDLRGCHGCMTIIGIITHKLLYFIKPLFVNRNSLPFSGFSLLILSNTFFCDTSIRNVLPALPQRFDFLRYISRLTVVASSASG